MWQDTAISVVQLIFAVALIPTIRDKYQKPAVLTSAMNAAGMAVLVAAYSTLGLGWSAFVAAVVFTEWCVLGGQRYLFDLKT